VANIALKPIKSLLLIKKCSNVLDLQQDEGVESLDMNAMLSVVRAHSYAL